MLGFTFWEELGLQVELLTWRLAEAAQPLLAESERPAGMTGAVCVRDGVQQRVPGTAVERRVRRAPC